MSERVIIPAPVRQESHRQTRAEAQAIYADVTARDVTCRAPTIKRQNGDKGFGSYMECYGKLERHHAGNTVGSKRITDARHVVLLCKWHHRTWAPSHSCLILDWLARVEDAREKGIAP